MLDLALYNGVVLSNGAATTGTAVGVRDNRITAIGSNGDVLHACGPSTTRIDLGGRTLSAGFNDAHAHIWKIGHLETTMVDLRRVGSLEELVQTVRDFGARLPADAWIVGRGYNEAVFRDGRGPTRADLDRASRDRPIVLTRTCGHIYAVNDRALREAGIGPHTDAPPGGVIDRDERGEPTGVLRETAMGLITRAMPPPSARDYQDMIVAAQRRQLARGITSSADCGVSPELLRVYVQMAESSALRARANVMALRRVDGVPDAVPLPQKFVSDMLRVDTVKFLADGGLSGATAALSVPYRHGAPPGVLRFAIDDLAALCRESHDAGWRIATHAIGDVAIDQVLDVYQRLGPHPLGYRHRIEHFGLPDAAQLVRASRLGVIAAPQTIFVRSLGRNFRAYLPDAFMPRVYPVRSMLDAGIAVALSSDAPVVEDDYPLSGMAAAITRRDDEGYDIANAEAITIGEALSGYTMGGAIASGDDDNRGSIDLGKWADLVVLSQNPLTTLPDALTDIRVDMTMVGGKVVYQR